MSIEMSFDRSIEVVKRNLDFDGNNERRKRKSSPCSSGSYESCCSELESMHSSSLEISFKEAIGSSPIEYSRFNYELSSSLERCCIENDPKRIRWDGTKSSSAPNTPPRRAGLKRFNSFEFTPSKSLGTPERYEILYPAINEKPYRPKSPRNNRVAKKRLFVCRDFVHLFKNVRNCNHLISKILSYLNESDLVRFVQVSKVWNRAVRDDKNALERYKSYKSLFVCTKENIGVDNKHVQINIGKENIPSPVAKTKYEKCIKLANKIRGDQIITKCLRCDDPSILDRNGIAQCSKRSCGYIWCTKCLAGSDKGPDYFYCRCEKGNTPPPTSLGDISNTSPSRYYMEQPSLPADSGYLTNSDSISFNRRSVLSDSNHSWSTPNISRQTPRSPDAAAYCATAEICKQRRIPRSRNDDPSSPPRVKNNIISSRKSKKNLRRLL